MKVLITGINGFVGKILQKELITRSHEVYGIDYKSDSDMVFSADLRDYDSIKSIINDIKPDKIVHLAAVSRVDFENVNEIYEINVNGTLNLLKASVSSGGAIPLLFVSSSQVYGNPELEHGEVISEEFKVSPVNHYGASKAAAENIAMAFYHENKVPLSIVRPFNHTGAGQTVNFVVPKIANAFRQRDESINLGNIDTVRDFLDVRDVVSAYISLIENFQEGEIFNIASGRGIVIRDIIGILQKIAGYEIEIIQEERFCRKNEISAPIGDFSKINNILGWNPRYEFTETLEWMLS